jgi:RND family efflux transporter MFP subunit
LVSIRMHGTVALVLVAVILSGCGGGGGTRHRRGHGTGPQGPQTVPVATAAQTTVRPSDQIAGIIAPFQNVAISSSLSEPTDVVNVLQGDTVHKGEVLAVLDTADLRASYNSALSSAYAADARVSQTQYQAELNIKQGGDQVQNARAALLQAQQSAHQAEIDLARDVALLNNGYVSQQTVDQQRTLAHNDEQAVSSAKASLQSAITNQQVNGTYQQGLQAANVNASRADAGSSHAQASQIEAQIAKSVIVSPVDGVVVNRNLNPGEYPGSRTIFTVQQLDPVYAELNASSQDVFRIQRGAPVNIAVAGGAGVNYRGTVNAVLGQVQPGSTNFTVEVTLRNPGLHLKSGMAVTGTVALPAISGVGIPATAFLTDDHDSVMVVDASGDAKTQNVTERGSDGKTSIVTGLPAGTKVISSGQLGITNGEQVSVR